MMRAVVMEAVVMLVVVVVAVVESRSATAVCPDSSTAPHIANEKPIGERTDKTE